MPAFYVQFFIKVDKMFFCGGGTDKKLVGYFGSSKTFGYTKKHFVFSGGEIVFVFYFRQKIGNCNEKIIYKNIIFVVVFFDICHKLMASDTKLLCEVCLIFQFVCSRKQLPGYYTNNLFFFRICIFLQDVLCWSEPVSGFCQKHNS